MSDPGLKPRVLTTGVAHADKYDDTVTLFRNAGQSAAFFHKSYAYAVFPRWATQALSSARRSVLGGCMCTGG